MTDTDRQTDRHACHNTSHPVDREAVITSISADADGPRDAASFKMDHIALPNNNYQATSVGW